MNFNQVWLSIFIAFVVMTFSLVGIPGIYFKFIAGKLPIDLNSTVTSPPPVLTIWTLTRLGDATIDLAKILTNQGIVCSNIISI